MRNVFKNNYFKLGLTIFCVIAACIIFFFLIYQIGIIIGAIKILIKILVPFILGFIFAYLLNPIVKIFDRGIFTKILNKTNMPEPKRQKVTNYLAIGHTFILMLAIIILLFSFIIPELLQSIESLAINIPNYLVQIRNYLLDLLKNNEALEEVVLDNYEAINTYINNAINNTFLPILDQWIINFSNGILGFMKGLYNTLLGFIIAIYFLGDKETFKAQIKKSLYSVFSIKTANNIIDNARATDKIFGNFIVGKMLDSTLIGFITFMFLSIFGFPYALLIGVIIGLSNMIPYFGPFIGAVPSALLILLQSPSRCLIFIIFILVLQQIDGNYIDPKLVGSKTGMKSFWVLFAIILFGGLFGLPGLLVGVPLFALLYGYIRNKFNDKLIKKDLPLETHKYANLNRINSENKKIVENKKTKNF